jgi:hypothetical protein
MDMERYKTHVTMGTFRLHIYQTSGRNGPVWVAPLRRRLPVTRPSTGNIWLTGLIHYTVTRRNISPTPEN